MRIYCGRNYDEASRIAAKIIAAQIVLKPDCVLGLATGSTPIGAYEQLVRWYEKGDLDFSRVTTVNLDEYRGLGERDDQSYRYFMNTHLFDHVNIRKACTHVPNGLEQDAEKACREYDELIAALGGIDLQLLGIGHDGHIGFNEPSDAFDTGTHCVDLAEMTIEANARFFGGDKSKVPTQAYTMGIRTIMAARKVMLMACGRDKRQIVTEAFSGPVTPKIPASALQLHPDVILVGDETALRNLI